ncbi:MAG: hypothetical protein M1819_004171 [Sarea resinae]|nr:MAG: hypothetical protein M1819_004171 [Sarea resinae]
MSSDAGNNIGDEAADETGPLDPSSMAGLTSAILDDCLQNILHDIVLKTHREEKILRMQSAAIVAEQAAEEKGIKTKHNSEELESSPLKSPTKPTTAGGKVETPGAIYDNGRIYIRSNPFKTTKEILCTRCRLPRLLYPTTGKGARPPPDPNKQYCARHPFIDKPGHDIYGNPFPSDSARAKKDAKMQSLKANDSRPGTPSGNGTTTPTTTTAGPTFPTIKCPVCTRSLIITRFAQHLEKCMGISGRQSSRNAMAKMNSQQSGNTPLGSRTGTPVPGATGNGSSSFGSGSNQLPSSSNKKNSPVKRAREDDDKTLGDASATPPPQKKKKVFNKKTPAATATALDRNRFPKLKDSANKLQPSKLATLQNAASNTSPSRGSATPSTKKEDKESAGASKDTEMTSPTFTKKVAKKKKPPTTAAAAAANDTQGDGPGPKGLSLKARKEKAKLEKEREKEKEKAGHIGSGPTGGGGSGGGGDGGEATNGSSGSTGVNGQG